MISSLFKNQLLRLDKTLYIKLERGLQRYVVYRRDRANRPRKILMIEDENGGFSYPNYKHIAQIYKMDSWQNKNLIKEMDEYNESLDKEFDERIERISSNLSKQMTRTQYY